MAIATAVTSLVLGAVRLFGGLQPLETLAYDQFLRLRPSEAAQDDRLLIVKVDSPSGEWLRSQMIRGHYEPGIGTIPDQALAEAIEVLNRHEARVIGLDFFRDFPTEEPLVQQLAKTDNLVGICQSASRQVEEIPEIASEMPNTPVGFANFLFDGGTVIRRQSLTQWVEDDNRRCAVEESFTLQLTKAYLAVENVGYNNTSDEYGLGTISLGDVEIPDLYGDGTAYSSMALWQDWSSLQDYQTLINFRTYDKGDTDGPATTKLINFAQQVSLDAVIRNEVDPELIRDRIVLIGYTDFSDRNSDAFNTPYGDSVPGVYLHGQMISQLVNAVLEDRPLMRWWPFLGETVWILWWSGVGGVVFWRFVRRGPLLLAGLGSISLLTLACYGFMVGPVIWVPWVPALVGWAITSSTVSYMTYRLRKG